MDKYQELFEKTMRRLNGERIESSEEVVSVGTVVKSVSQAMELYNIILVKSQDGIIKRLNRSIGYRKFTPKTYKKSLPRVADLINSVDEKGNVSVLVLFEDGNKATVCGDSENVNVDSTTLVGGDIIDFVVANKETFNIYLGTLKEFAMNYPGVKVDFNKNSKNESDQVLNDGFLSCDIKIVCPEKSGLIFSSMDDHYLSVTKTRRYGEIHDYLSFYNEEFMDKTSVNVGDLNPFIKSCVSEYLTMSDDINLTLSK